MKDWEYREGCYVNSDIDTPIKKDSKIRFRVIKVVFE